MRRRTLLLLTSVLFVKWIYAGPLETGTPQEKIAFMDALVETAEKPDKKIAAALSWTLSNPEEAVLVRERAAWTIGQLSLKSEVISLITACKSNSLLIRSAALDSLMHWKAKTALSTYVQIAQNDPVLSMKQRAVLALGLTRSEKAIDPIVVLSENSLPEIRGAASISMGALHSNKNSFKELLTEMASDPDPYVTNRAKASLEIIQGKNQVVQGQLKSTDSDIRLFAAYYFHENGKESDLTALNAAQKTERNKDVKFELKQGILAVEKRVKQEKKRKEEKRKRELEAQKKKEKEAALQQPK